MRLLDRYLLRHFLAAYVVCFVSLLALYVLIDVFTKLDEFAEHASGTKAVLGKMAEYYLYRLPWFFQRLSAVLSLLAVMSTLAWLQRQNEVLPILAAGVPAWRMLAPLLLAVVGVIGLSLANREWLVPQCSPYLQGNAQDPAAQGAVCIGGCYDANQIHFEGKAAFPQANRVEFGRITIPAQLLGTMVHLSCRVMKYRPANGRDSSGWYLHATQPEKLECRHPVLNWLKPGIYFLHTDLTFERLTRSSNWFYFEPTSRLLQLARDEGQIQRRTEVIALLHQRLTAPLLELILVLLGIPLILGRPDQSLYLKLGLGLVAYAVFYGVQFTCHHFAQRELLDPTLAAWLPVFLFGPLALALLDTIRR